MRKKLLLFLATFGLAIGAYLVFSSGDRLHRSRKSPGDSTLVRRFVSPPTTQPAPTLGGEEMTFSPGDQTRVRIYDDVTGRLKYQFEAATWEPTSQTDFRLTHLLIQLYMPRGEIAYISADQADIQVARRGKSRVDPKRGQVRGHVSVTIDRTTAQWREANQHLADRFAHPDDLINIEMGDSRFDLDRCELVCDGDVLVDSSEARIERVRGLTVQWDQVDNRIDVLRFRHGGTMALRRGGRQLEFTMPGMEHDAKGPKSPSAATPSLPQAAGDNVPLAQANRPTAVRAVSAEQAAEEIRLEGGAVAANRPRSLAEASSEASAAATAGATQGNAQSVSAAVESMKSEARAAEAGELLKTDIVDALAAKSRRRIHTYRAVFTNHVVVEQKDGLRTIGKIEADKLEINFDFGKNRRDFTQPDSEPGPADASAAAPAPATRPTAEPRPEAPREDATKLVLTWDGPLEMRPIRVEADQQTGQRFDVIATGAPVRIESDQGTARCRQLVYRHERRQVWLSVGDAGSVQMAFSATRRLEGREVFFDQKRGLARIEGPGSMFDDRPTTAEAGHTKDAGVRAMAGPAPAEQAKAKTRPPVTIRWNHGVDLEIGTRGVQRTNPSTGLKEAKDREYLRRAWFHGDVELDQGDEHLSAQEVAVTFGLPLAQEEMADHIQHLSLSGQVRLKRADDLITADELDAEMTVMPGGRNVPRMVNAAGDVLAQQGRREIHARQMRVVLAPGTRADAPSTPASPPAMSPSSRLGIESLDARGDVRVLDPGQNLKISRADALHAVMRNGNELIRCTIESPDPAVFAQARFSDIAIHGHRVLIDVEKQTIDVPGPGASWMNSRQDLGGRRLSESTPVKTTWSDRMQFRLAHNYGVFLGKVRSESTSVATGGRKQTSVSLACDRLTVRLAKPAPPPPRPPKENSRLEKLREMVAGKPDRSAETLTALPGGERKEPVYLVAEGHAEALASSYALAGDGSERGPLQNRMRIASDQIAADLLHQQMNIKSSGTLMIEDYQFAPEKPGLPLARPPREAAPLMSAMRNEGPSQTLVTWENSMDYFQDRALVVFDRNVSMVHRSGQEMVLRDELASAMKVDHESIKRLASGRRATLTCGNLLLEFNADPAGPSRPAQTPVRATDLKRLIAKGAVHLQDGTKSLMGAYLQYLQDAEEVRLEGGEGVEARIIDQEEKDQRLSMWKGPLLIWNRRTNQIEAPQATIRSSRR